MYYRLVDPDHVSQAEQAITQIFLSFLISPVQKGRRFCGCSMD